MTRPTTPPPPPGPRPSVTATRDLVAALAGARGRSAEPLHRRRRERSYWLQNGTERLTPKQRRRLEHKALRAALRGAVA